MVKGRPIAVNICYENGFGTELLYSAQQADFMLNVSDLSWYGTSTAKDQHLQISQARALENQRYFVQDTNSGLTAIIAPNGSIQNLAASFSRYILYGTIQGRSGSTPYQRYGDSLIISICLLMIALSSIYSITWKLKTKSTSIKR
jgi:apolipoprotein N-acyltransferase